MGTIIDCITIIIGCFIGLIVRGRLSDRVSSTIMNGLALCVYVIKSGYYII